MEEQRSKQNRKRENQGEGCRRHLRPFLASLLFRLMSSPSTPSPASHPPPRRTITEWNGAHPVRFWAMLSPPHRHTSTPIDQQPEGQRLVLSVILPASSSSPSPLPGCDGREESQPGRSTPSRSPCLPSPPCRGASAYWRTPPERGRAAGCHLRAAAVVFEKVCFGIFFTVVSL